MNTNTFWKLIFLQLIFQFSCNSPASQVPPASGEGKVPTLTPNQAETATLQSLEQVDEYPLYMMRYFGTFPGQIRTYEVPDLTKSTIISEPESCPLAWGCSLFAALADEQNRFLGRNFDWRFSPALLLFTDPVDGYASVSMVDIEYLGFEGDHGRNLTDLSLDERRPLLDAPSLPFDGMNEKGLAVGMAAVPAEEMPFDPQKRTLGQLEVIREILDHAETVDQAIEILSRFNIDMGSVPIHYVIASASGESAVVEFFRGQMVVFRNDSPWQVATNFLIADSEEEAQGLCWRYDLIEQHLNELNGRVTSKEAFRLLEDVSQDITQWSILYHMSSGDLDVVMGRNYSGTVHSFHLDQSIR